MEAEPIAPERGGLESPAACSHSLPPHQASSRDSATASTSSGVPDMMVDVFGDDLDRPVPPRLPEHPPGVGLVEAALDRHGRVADDGVAAAGSTLLMTDRSAANRTDCGIDHRNPRATEPPGFPARSSTGDLWTIDPGYGDSVERNRFWRHR